ncbi:FG-GAP repeat protein [bacterium BMS3Bbin04]|nr:FG-GAP repeat protein [bacterium BMS3Bbin04]
MNTNTLFRVLCLVGFAVMLPVVSISQPTFEVEELTWTPEFNHVTLLADVDVDGDLDIVANSGQYNGLSWIEQAEGEWIHHQISDFDQYEMVVDDLNNDGRPDILTSTNGLMAWLNLPQGWVYVVLVNLYEGYVNDIKVADLSGDGINDIIISEGFGNDGTELYWYERRPDNELVYHLIRDNLPPYLPDFVTGDIDGDGDPDIVVGESNTTSLAWLENPTWTIHEIDADSDYASQLQVIDVDEDGDLDIIGVAVEYAWPDDIYSLVWWERHPGGFIRHIIPVSTTYIGQFIAGYVDDDGHADIIRATYDEFTGDQMVAHYFNEGEFSAEVLVFNDDYTLHALDDLDGDGFTDIVTDDSDYYYAFYQQPGAWVRESPTAAQPSEPTLSVIPNPVNGTATINLTGHLAGNLELKLYDSLGRQVWTHALPGVMAGGNIRLALPTKNLASGVYMLRAVMGNNQTAQTRIVVLK